MNRYGLKRKALLPITAIRRRRANKLSGTTLAMYEAHDYRPALRRFLKAASHNPDILCDVDVPAGGVVLDIGAFEGEWTTRVLARADRGGVRDIHVHAFEPIPNAIRRFEANVTDRSRVTLHPFGLSGDDQRVQMAIAGPGSTVFTKCGPAPPLGLREVQLRDVDTVLHELHVDAIALMKVNIEGGEYELFDRLATTGWLTRVSTIIVQFHEFAPGAHRKRQRVRSKLTESHRCTWNYPWVYERWDRTG